MFQPLLPHLRGVIIKKTDSQSADNVDENGNLIQDLQNPDTPYSANTSVTETRDHLYIGSLFAPETARLQ